MYNVLFSEELQGVLATMGSGHIRFWRMATTFTGLKLQGQTGRFGSHDISNIEACVLLGDGKVLSGCEEGTLLLWEEALLMAEFGRERWGNCHCGNIIQMMMMEGEVVTMGEDGYIRAWHVDRIVLVDPSYAGQTFHIEPLYEYHVSVRGVPMHMVEADPDDQDRELWYVQDREGTVWNVDLSITSTYRKPKAVLQCHGGPVTGCAVSPRSHLVATIGEDGKLRVFDCLRMKELFSMAFTAPLSALLWFPLSVDSRAASVVVGLDNGTVKKIAFSATTAVGQKGIPSLVGRLSQVFKPHKGRVTTLACSPDGAVLVSGGSDDTLFFFGLDGTRLEPIGWLHAPAGIRQLVWTPPHYSYKGLLATCELGQVVELQLQQHSLSDVNVAANLQLKNLKLKFFVFRSVKSEIQHAEEVTRLEEERIKLLADWTIRRAQEEVEESQEEAEPVLKEEDDWKEFIPDPPCPILQAAYSSSREGHFWLTLGGYDAGYLYLCQFPDRCLAEEGDDASRYVRKPLKTVAVPDCYDSPVSVLKLDTKRRRALLGFGNGHLRLVQLDEAGELDDLSAYWDLSVHDNKLGRLTGLAFAFDDSFLISTGMDGNIMVFSHADQLAGVQPRDASLPVSSMHHETCSEDLPPEALWFPDAIDKQMHDKQLAEAEAGKQRKRLKVKELHQRLKSVQFQNQVLPQHMRLSRNQMLVNLDLDQEHEQQQERKLAELHRQCAWRSEKLRLLLQKAETGLHRHEELPRQFAVASFCGSLEVRSYRVPATGPAQQQLLEFASSNSGKNTPGRMKRQLFTQASVQGDTADVEDCLRNQMWQNVYAMTRRRSAGLTGTAARCLQMALDRANRAKQKQSKRQEEWDEFKEKKALILQDDPEELQAIEEAKRTIGDIRLKTDPLRAVRMAEDYSHDATCRRLGQLEKQIRDRTQDFNKKLMSLREEKYTIVQVLHELDNRLRQLSSNMKSIRIPLLSRNEFPEVDLAFDEQVLVKFKNEYNLVQDEQFDTQALSINANQSQKNEAEQKKPLFRHTYYKAERSDYPDAVKFVLNQSVERESKFSIIDSIFLGRAKPSELSSRLRRDINTFSRLQIDFEGSLTENVASSLMEEFDAKLRAVRKERFELDSLLKQADMTYTAMLEEFLVDQKTRSEEDELKTERMAIEQHLEKNTDVMNKLQTQIATLVEESEELERQLSSLFYEFKAECIDVDKEGNKTMRYLTLLYRRRVKHKKEKKAGEDEESDSDEESSSDSCSLMSDSSTASSVSWDLDECPRGVERELYDTVLLLQARRQVLDDQQDDLKQKLAVLTKELEMKSKETDAVYRALEQVQESLVKFYQNKIKLLNKIRVAVTLMQSRIYCRASRGLVVDLDVLRRLKARESELMQETLTYQENMRSHTDTHLALRRGCRQLKRKINELEKKCEAELVRKFGKPLSLLQLHLVTVNPKVELLKCRVVMDKDNQLEKEQRLDQRIMALRGRLAAITRLNTTRYLAKSDVVAEMNDLERRLDAAAMRIDIGSLIPRPEERVSDREKLGLTRLVQHQAQVIDTCWSEIDLLDGDDVTGRRQQLQRPVHVCKRRSQRRQQSSAKHRAIPRFPGI